MTLSIIMTCIYMYACEFSVVYIMRTGYVIVCTFDCRFICSNYSGLC